jgi:hypothetical protein
MAKKTINLKARWWLAWCWLFHRTRWQRAYDFCAGKYCLAIGMDEDIHYFL